MKILQLRVMVILISLTSMTSSTIDFGETLGDYFKGIFLGMSIATCLTGISGAYIGGVGYTTSLPTLPEKKEQKFTPQQMMMMRQAMAH